MLYLLINYFDTIKLAFIVDIKKCQMSIHYCKILFSAAAAAAAANVRDYDEHVSSFIVLKKL